MMSMPDDEVFCSALECESAELQDRCVQAMCAGDPAQAHRVQQLLQSYRQMHSSMNAPRPSLLDRAEEVFQAFSLNDDLEPGRTVGPYSLLGKIGEGGMGLVYHARQAHPLQRDVALKLLKPGMDSQRILARFALERHVLERLEHPGITRILDAGVQENGRPFFAMELVPDPVTITEYADKFELGLRARLELMISVCEIIQHAHQRGIIHRDLKPSNILLEGKTLPRPVPKVIDFGIAKLVRPASDNSNSITTLGERFGTPAYMSPEQALNASGEVDIRSDVYSLGVILYELLTAATPRCESVVRDKSMIWTSEAYWDQDIPLPSQRLRQCSEATTRTWHFRDLKGELDWIARKALARDRDERYQTVADLQRDLERYLVGDPIEAAGPGLSYRLKKLVRRNRVATSAVVLILLTIVSTSILTASYAVRARHAESEATRRLKEVLEIQQELTVQRDNAEHAKRQAQSVLRVFQVQSVMHKSLSNYLGDWFESTDRLANLDLSVFSESKIIFDAESLSKPHQRLIVRGNWEWAAASFPSEMISASFKLSSREAARTVTAAPNAEPPSTPPKMDLGDLPALRTDDENRRSFQTILLEELRSILAPGDPFIAEVLDNRGLAGLESGDLIEAEKCFRESVSIWAEAGRYPENLAQSEMFLAEVLLLKRKPEAALRSLQSAQQTLDKVSSTVAEINALREFHQQLMDRFSLQSAPSISSGQRNDVIERPGR